MTLDLKGLDTRETEAWVKELGLEAYRANQEEAAKVIAEAFDGDIRNDSSGVRFNSILNGGPWGHVDVSGNGTVMIEIRNLPVRLAVQIGNLLKGETL